MFFLRVGLCLFAVMPGLMAQPLQRLSLPEAISIALQKNEQVLTAAREVDAASGLILQAGRIPNPDLYVTFNEIPTDFDIGAAGERDIGISQTIEFPGKVGSRVDAAESNLAIAELALQRVKTIVSSEVKTAYYKVLLSAEVVDNLEFTISLITDFLQVVTQRYQAGSSGYLDVIRTKVELTRVRNDLTEAKRDYELRLSELDVILGNSDEEVVVLTDSMFYSPIGVSADSVVDLLIQQSALMEMKTLMVARAQSLLSTAENSYWPDFTLGASLQKRPGQISPTGSSNYLGLEASISLPLWFWQGPRGEVRESQATLEVNNVRLDATRRRVRQGIGAAYRTALVAGEQLKVFDTTLLADVEDELRAGISAYQNNQIDVLDVFDIYRTHRATKVEHARALYNYSAAVAQLEAAKELPE